MNPPRFDPAAFTDPPNRFRPLRMVHGFDDVRRTIPTLGSQDGIEEGLDRLLALGYGGAVVNVGFRDYLESPQQWDLFRRGLEAASRRNLVLWWYDEAGYPSGTAGGLVTRAHPEFASLGLACYHVHTSGPASTVFARPPSCHATVWVGAACADLRTVQHDQFVDLSDHVAADGTLRWTPPSGDWTVLYLAERVNPARLLVGPTGEERRYYVDLLNPAVTAEFMRLTHEAYLRETPPELWQRFRAVFTDEPQLLSDYGERPLPPDTAEHDHPPFVPWSRALRESFRTAKGYDLGPYLYALFCSETEEAAYVRQDFYEVMTQQYVEAFFAPIRTWCRAHGIASSGHLLNEEWLGTHVGSHGSLFAPLRQLDIPGIDLLNADPIGMLEGLGFMTAKQASSVAHLTGAEEVHCESSGPMPLAHRIGQANLLNVLGVNQITSYWGCDAVDRPEYRTYNDYAGRLALMLRGGRHVCDVAMLYPIRAAWATFVPHSPLASANLDSPAFNEQLDRLGGTGYAQPVRDLLRSQIDLDIVDEQAILDATIDGSRLCVAQERYRILILPAAGVLAADVVEKLVEWTRLKGHVLFIDTPPVRGESNAATERVRRAVATLQATGTVQTVPLSQIAGAVRMAGVDDFTLSQPDPDILYTHRVIDGRDIYFVINATAVPKRIRPRLGTPGPYTLLRPLTGTLSPAPSGDLDLAAFEGVFLTPISSTGCA